MFPWTLLCRFRILEGKALNFLPAALNLKGVHSVWAGGVWRVEKAVCFGLGCPELTLDVLGCQHMGGLLLWGGTGQVVFSKQGGACLEICS